MMFFLTKNSDYKNIKTFDITALLTAFICFWVPAIAFSKIAGEITEHEPIAGDSWALHAIHSHATSFYDSAFVTITTIGSAEVIAPLTLLLTLYLLYRRSVHQAILLAFGVGGAAVANIVLKALFHRQRPSFWPSLVTEHSYSFPSGHAMVSSALALCLIMLTWHSRWRWAVTVGGAIFTMLIGFSRLYLGVHYPTDILAGWAVSVLWVFLVSSLVSDMPFKLKSRFLKKARFSC